MKLLFPDVRMTSEEREEHERWLQQERLRREALIGEPHESGPVPWYLVRVDEKGQRKT